MELPNRTLRLEPDGWSVGTIDQTRLPAEEHVVVLRSLADAADAIARMVVRGAPLIGATAAYGLALAAREDPSDAAIEAAAARLLATRPTAVNLRWAVRRVLAALSPLPPGERAAAAYRVAAEICDEDVEINRRIGEHGLELLRALARERPDRPLRILTHCNAGRLATVAWGTATASIYMAHAEGIPLHVWVDETRPRLQGALTAWELGRAGVPHTLIADNTGGHLIQRGRVDVVITGADRVTAAGDVANKIGTYLKAVAARDCGVPFYVAVPSPSIDWEAGGADDAVPIEERDARELSAVRGADASGGAAEVVVYPEGSPVLNVAFDVTPARLITGLITERGVASPRGLAALFPEHAPSLEHGQGAAAEPAGSPSGAAAARENRQ